MASNYDVIVIGAGHNGLTAAALLAKRGARVLVVEKRDRVGGLAAREEFRDRYMVPAVLHDTSGVRHRLIRSLRLDRHGLEIAADPPAIYAPERGGRGLLLKHDPSQAGEEISRFAAGDAEQYVAFRGFIDRVRGVVNRLLDEPPPELFGARKTIDWALLKRARSVRKLGKRDMMEVARIAPMSVADWLDEWFEGDLLKALLAAPALCGSFTGPRSPGTALNLLIWECRKGALVKGGGVALVEALRRAAEAAGAEIRTGARVDRLITKDGRVAGVSLQGDEIIGSRKVAAACDPKQTLLTLLETSAISGTLAQRMRSFRARGTTAKVNIALRARIELAGRPQELVELVRFGQSLDDLERAFDPVKYGRYAVRPMLEVYVPGATDPAAAPVGHTVLSCLVHFVPYELESRWDYSKREALGQCVLSTLREFAPGIGDALEGIEVLTPAELESRYGLSNGHIFHGEHAIDQMLVRPSPECARYETPVEGLFLCGSGSHPGGGLTCAPGALAARCMLGAS